MLKPTPALVSLYLIAFQGQYPLLYRAQKKVNTYADPGNTFTAPDKDGRKRKPGECHHETQVWAHRRKREAMFPAPWFGKEASANIMQAVRPLCWILVHP